MQSTQCGKSQIKLLYSVATAQGSQAVQSEWGQIKSSLHQCQQDRTLATKKALGPDSKIRTKVTLSALREVMLTILKTISIWEHCTVLYSAAAWVYNLASYSITSWFISKHPGFWFSSMSWALHICCISPRTSAHWEFFSFLDLQHFWTEWILSTIQTSFRV